jgi:hypothetical protein
MRSTTGMGAARRVPFTDTALLLRHALPAG